MDEDVFRAIVIAVLLLGHGVALLTLLCVRAQRQDIGALKARLDARSATPPARPAPVKVRGFFPEQLPERVPDERIDAGDGPPLLVHYPRVSDDDRPRC